MTNEIRRGKKYQHFFYRAMTVSLGILLISETVAANTLNSKIAQQLPAITSPSRNSEANKEGQKLLDEALELIKQGTSQSRTNALAKYEQALAIGQKIGDRPLVALAL